MYVSASAGMMGVSGHYLKTCQVAVSIAEYRDVSGEFTDQIGKFPVPAEDQMSRP